MVTLALYKAKGDVFNRLISWRTASPYSHCEIVIDGTAFSASLRDKGVRGKAIVFDADKWDLLPLPAQCEASVRKAYITTAGHRYDLLGCVLGRGLDAPIEDKTKWFCSEWCAFALGFPEPWRYSPAMLASAVSAPWLSR